MKPADPGIPRAFTVDEVDALLPRVEAVMSRIREELFHIHVRRDKLAVLDALWGEAVEEATNPDHRDFRAHRQRIDVATERIETLVRTELTAEGIRFPPGGLEHGLLDFPTTYQGRWVYLCWRSGEERVAWWHEVDGGFAGRRPLTPEQARTMGREAREHGGGRGA